MMTEFGIIFICARGGSERVAFIPYAVEAEAVALSKDISFSSLVATRERRLGTGRRRGDSV